MNIVRARRPSLFRGSWKDGSVSRSSASSRRCRSSARRCGGG